MFTSDYDLTEEKFLEKYLECFGRTNEIELYLKLRYNYVHKIGNISSEQVSKAYMDTDLIDSKSFTKKK